MKGVITVDLLKEILEVESIFIGKAIYVSDAGAFSDAWLDNIVLAYVTGTEAEKRTVFEPSFAYTLRKKSKPEIDTYDEGKKLRLIRNTDIFVPKLVGAEAGYIINDTN